jgi:hypothetical protein
VNCHLATSNQTVPILYNARRTPSNCVLYLQNKLLRFEKIFIVPTLQRGNSSYTAPAVCKKTLERQERHSHAARGNDRTLIKLKPQEKYYD